ncbi:Mediator of RNA polymerase II transcription subunit 17 [Cichlidogyrus casuarinus]|uniref:Mediator of RNA polymerase II transcription subunit 17 n=1 Tax=Cichlidogyrus casuarinus TaxID=1844966 RepID=A0ABD2Q8I9_9PLAT
MTLIPCEALSEFDVDEIFPDGRERIVKPLTPTENFQRIVNQIDFHKESPENKTSSSESSAIPNEIIGIIRENVRNAYYETCALSDVLSVVLDKRFLTLNPVSQNPPNYKKSLVLAGKKIALGNAAQMLHKSAERLKNHLHNIASYRGTKKNEDGTTDNTNAVPSFHMALINLRKYWRLRIFQNSILGDVSLTSAGSRFRESGAFEIKEADPSKSPDCPLEITFNRNLANIMDRAVYPGMLLVRIQKVSSDNQSKSLLWQSIFAPESDSLHTQGQEMNLSNPLKSLDEAHDRLNFAQRVLACREIISTLANEASFSRFPGLLSAGCMAFATQDEVVASLFPDVQVSVKMLTKMSNSSDFNPQNVDDISDDLKADYSRLPDVLQIPSSTKTKQQIKGGLLNSKNDPITSLAIQLMRILHEMHQSSWSNLSSVPNPTTTPVQVPRALRAAGSQALTADALTDSREISAGMLSSSLQVGIAAVSGFAGPASAAWISATKGSSQVNTTLPVSSVSNTNILRNPTNVGPLNQERHSMFAQWSNLENKEDSAATASGAESTASHVAAYESALMRSGSLWGFF